MKTSRIRALIFVCVLLMVPLLHALRVHRGTSDYGSGGQFSAEGFTPAPPVQNPDGAITTTMEVCAVPNGQDNCGAPHSFIYQVQLGSTDPGTITSITLTVNGQSVFENSPNYGVLICDLDGAPAPCSPAGATLTNCRALVLHLDRRSRLRN